ncbi:MAG: hypothetical protein IIZ74_12095 [Erysipelotrichaceae bacterium]|nr:hypothetical protein [Erysipelotrichaceae bacterium]
MKDLGELKKLPNGLYQDRNKRQLLINFKKKDIYVVSNEKMKMYQLFRSRYVVSLMILIIVSVYFEWKFAIPAGIISFILLEISYAQFVQSLDMLKNYEMPEEQDAYTAFSKDPHKVNVKRVVASFLLTLVIIGSGIYFYITRNPNGFTLNIDNVLLIVMEVVFIYLALKNGFTALRVLNNEKKGKE